MPCDVVYKYWYFIWNCYIHLPPWRWRQHIPLTNWYMSVRVNSVSYKMVVICIGLKMSNLTSCTSSFHHTCQVIINTECVGVVVRDSGLWSWCPRYESEAWNLLSWLKFLLVCLSTNRMRVWDLRFSQRCCWRLLLYGMLCCVVGS
jgi:hypothetical protein